MLAESRCRWHLWIKPIGVRNGQIWYGSLYRRYHQASSDSLTRSACLSSDYVAKSYKRPTKKEKIGITAAQNSAKLAQIQRNVPISAQFSGNPRGTPTSRPVKASLDPAEQSAIEQKAQKLLVEAERRAAELRGEESDADEDMDGAATGAAKKKTGAAGLKKKASKRKTDGSSSSRDYVDLLYVNWPRILTV